MVGSDDLKKPFGANMPVKSAACPLGKNLLATVLAIGRKDARTAAKTILDANALPSICGRVCIAPCLGAAKVDIPTLKQFSEQVSDSAMPAKLDADAPKVAVIGSGPAGLAAAHRLLKLGLKPVVFEATAKAGGMLSDVVPALALPREMLAADVANLEKMGAEIRTGVKAGTDVTWDEVENNHAAVLVATGAGKPVMPPIPGTDLEGVTHAIDFCRKAEAVSGDIVVEGGNAGALQVARTAKQLGATNVCVVHPYPIALWPVSKETLETAAAEGIELLPENRITELWGYEKIETVIVRPVVETRNVTVGRAVGGDMGTPRRITASTFIATVNRKPLEAPVLDGITIGVLGNVKVDKDYRLPKAGWYAAGEAATGPEGILDAMVTGKLAAQTIKNDLEAK
jgi:NADPH-dependent glutamate synthase beta subunit-like oxidoreductase